MKQLMNLSYWAKKHVWTARILLVAATLLLIADAFASGVLLHLQGIQATPWLIAAGFTALAAGIIFYPEKAKKGIRFTKNEFFVLQKTCDSLLVGSLFLMMLHQGNFFARTGEWYYRDVLIQKAYGSLPSDSVSRTYLTAREFSASLKDEKGELKKWKVRKQLLKNQVQHIRNAKELSDSAKGLLIVLSVLIAIGLLALIAGLACDLSCSGNDSGALALVIGGTAAVVLLFLLVMRQLYPRGSKRKESKPEPESAH